tara:strand:- start:60 stop:275 length:216 start_codon:yes stop_codon:yes gene_type:complete
MRKPCKKPKKKNYIVREYRVPVSYVIELGLFSAFIRQHAAEIQQRADYLRGIGSGVDRVISEIKSANKCKS